MITPRKIVITGIGIVSPLGVGQKAWDCLIQSRSGIGKLQSSDPFFKSVPCQVVGQVPRGDYAHGKWSVEEWLPKSEIKRTPLFAQFAISAAKQAMQDARWSPQSDTERIKTGVAIGSGIGGLDSLYSNSVAYNSGGYHKVSPLLVPSLLNNMAAGNVSTHLRLRGPNHAVSTACATGAHAIGDAVRFIQSGSARVMLAGSTEACIHPLALAGFCRARCLATKFNDEPEKASRPFDKSRCGFVMSEGAAVLVMETLTHALERGLDPDRDIYAELAGYGVSADGFHITAPDSSGRGALRAMQMACREAGVHPRDLDYINAHATSTQLGDDVEAMAIHQLMGEDSKIKTNISSTKGATGHLLGASGSLEAAITALAIKNNIMPPTLNLLQASGPSSFNYVPHLAQSHEIECALTNSFGFGGTNCSLVLKKLQTFS